MKLAIVGAGAIGGLIGAGLFEAGHEVNLIARGEHLRAILEQGLGLVENGVARRFAIPATDDAAELGPQDGVILAVKATAVTDVCEAIQPLLDSKTFVVTAQNGVPWWYFYKSGGPHEGQRLASVDPQGKLWDRIGPERAIGSVLYPAVAIAAPGLIEVYTHKSGNRMPIGEPDGSRSPRILALHEALVGAGFKAPVRPDIRTDIWVKLWGNLTFNPLSALTESTLGDFLADPDCRAVVEAMMREGEAVANALGITMPISMAKRVAGAKGIGSFKTSMLQDLESGRPMELDALVGAVAELGRLTNTSTPLINMIFALARQRAINAGCYPAGVG